MGKKFEFKKGDQFRPYSNQYDLVKLMGKRGIEFGYNDHTWYLEILKSFTITVKIEYNEMEKSK